MGGQDLRANLGWRRNDFSTISQGGEFSLLLGQNHLLLFTSERNKREDKIGWPQEFCCVSHGWGTPWLRHQEVGYVQSMVTSPLDPYAFRSPDNDRGDDLGSQLKLIYC